MKKGKKKTGPTLYTENEGDFFCPPHPPPMFPHCYPEPPEPSYPPQAPAAAYMPPQIDPSVYPLYTDSLKHIEPFSTCAHHCAGNLRMPMTLLYLLHIMHKQQLRWYINYSAGIPTLLVIQLHTQIPQGDGIIRARHGHNRIFARMELNASDGLLVECKLCCGRSM